MRFTLQPRRWYACEIIFDTAESNIARDHTPIRVDAVRPSKSGNRSFELDFFHATYPEGVQDKTYTLNTLLRGQSLLIAQSKSHEPSRILVIHELSADWLEAHFSIRSLSHNDLQAHLDREFPHAGIEGQLSSEVCGSELAIQLGNPDAPPQDIEMPPEIARVWQYADFSQLPENPSYREIESMALIIDGYGIARQTLGVENLFDWFNPIWEDYLASRSSLPNSSLHLWLMLFACQRGYLKDLGPPTKNIKQAIWDLYSALRSTLLRESENPNLQIKYIAAQQ